MLTLKIIDAHGTEWVPVKSARVLHVGATVDDPHGDIVGLLTEHNPEIDAEVIWHVHSPAGDEGYYAIVVQALHESGRYHNHVIKQGDGFLLGPDGKTLDRLF